MFSVYPLWSYNNIIIQFEIIFTKYTYLMNLSLDFLEFVKSGVPQQLAGNHLVYTCEYVISVTRSNTIT
jgi:hypothetical protein